MTPPLSPQAGKKDEKTGVLGALFGSKEKKEDRPEVLRAIEKVESNLSGNFEGILDKKASKAEQKLLEDFVNQAKPGDPIPAKVRAVYLGKAQSEYLLKLLGSAAFLSVEHSQKAMTFLKLVFSMNPGAGMSILYPAKWVQSHLELLDQILDPLKIESYLLWCLQYKKTEKFVGGFLVHLSAKYPEAFRHAVEKSGTEDYQYLMEKAAKGNPGLYREMNKANGKTFRDKVVGELTSWCRNGQAELRDYLLGETEVDTLFPFAKDWVVRGWYNNYWLDNRFQALKKSEEEQLYRRALVMEALRGHGKFLMEHGVSKGAEGIYNRVAHKDRILEVLRFFQEEGLPLHNLFFVLESEHDRYYLDREKTEFTNECVKALAVMTTGKDALDQIVRESKDASAYGRFLSIRILDLHWGEYKDALLACAMDSSKQVRELLEAVYASHKEWEPEILALLSSKKSQERELAVLTLKKWGADSYREALASALEKEKSKKIKTLIEECLGIAGGTEEPQAAKADGEELAAQLLKGGKKRKVSWAFETPFPELHKTDGALVSEDYLAAILAAYADMRIPGVSADASRLAAVLDQGELAACMDQLFGKWLETGAEAKKKWVLYAVSIHGGSGIIRSLYHQIQEWPQNARGAMAAEAVKALALNGDSEALLLVDQISRKFKFRQVKAAAGEALSYAAEQLGISRAELEDKIVPNLGFDEKMEQTFDYGTRTFRVVLSPSLELDIFDENEKKLKNLPAPGKRDEEEKAKAAYESFKQMKKQLKTVVSNQKLRLEQALSVERLWTVEKWQELFVKNPVMHQFAIGLIWGLYEDGSLKDTFRYMEDGSFNTVDEDEYELPAEGLIGLVHPIELKEETLAAWKEQLSDYEITQPMEQLSRPVYRLEEGEGESGELSRFGGKILNCLSLSGKLLGMGWYRGSVQDAGGYYEFYREDNEVGVELQFSGTFVGGENDEVTVYGAIFYKAGTVKRGSYVYDEVKKENQYLLKDVSPRYFSEIVLQLEKATASSKEQAPYPECKER